MFDDARRTLNERAAIKHARKQGFDLDEVRYCPECGRTVLFKQNQFNDDPRQGRVFCSCDSTGYPMIRPSLDDDEEDADADADADSPEVRTDGGEREFPADRPRLRIIREWTYRGRTCLTMKHERGHYVGYVEFTDGDRERGYYVDNQSLHGPHLDSPYSPHGGITWFDEDRLGFDCSHAGDVCLDDDGTPWGIYEGGVHALIPDSFPSREWTVSRVSEEVEDLADRLPDLSESDSEPKPELRTDGGQDFDRSGFSLIVGLIDYNRTDENGDPVVIRRRQELTNYELARTDRPAFVERLLRLAADDVLQAFRNEEDADPSELRTDGGEGEDDDEDTDDGPRRINDALGGGDGDGDGDGDEPGGDYPPGENIEIWRNYEEKRVGVRLGTAPEQLLHPAEADTLADVLEQALDDDELDAHDTRGAIDELRESAAELRDLRDEDEPPEDVQNRVSDMRAFAPLYESDAVDTSEVEEENE